jgi:plastocyanin
MLDASPRVTNKEAKMNLKTEFLRARGLIAAAFAAGALTALGTAVVAAPPDYSISQKGREFHPAEITIKRGEVIKIVNDDADLLHHAFIDSPTFSFDSGDQTPGTVTPITFTVAGNFNVLCAIHPKMLLVVHVQ